MIVPSTLSFLKDALLKQPGAKHEIIGSCKVYRIVKQQIESDEFIEDEQLYKASEEKLQEELSYDLDIISAAGLNVIVVPVLKDIIDYEIIARELLKFDEIEPLTITPGTLPFDLLIAKIGHETSGSNSSPFPKLVPPFIITGVSASLVSGSNKVEALVLQSEGVPGYEKINNDSINEIAHHLQLKYKLGASFTKDVESLVTTGSSVNNFGLYI